LGDVVADGRETGRIWGKHRTEVTEVTEGELALWVRGFGDAVAGKRERANLGKSSPRVTEVKKGILGLSPLDVGKVYQFPPL
jgi:hypothetical protein